MSLRFFWFVCLHIATGLADQNIPSKSKERAAILKTSDIIERQALTIKWVDSGRTKSDKIFYSGITRLRLIVQVLSKHTTT